MIRQEDCIMRGLSRRFGRLLVAGTKAVTSLMLLGSAVTSAAVPTDPAAKAQLVGQPIAVDVQPASLALQGPRASQQLLITGRYSDGSVRDLTAFCDLIAEAKDLVAIGSDGYVRPAKNGTTTLVVKAGGQIARVPVTVQSL